MELLATTAILPFVWWLALFLLVGGLWWYLRGRASSERDAERVADLARSSGGEAACGALAGRPRRDQGRILALAARRLMTAPRLGADDDDEDAEVEDRDWDLDDGEEDRDWDLDDGEEDPAQDRETDVGPESDEDEPAAQDDLHPDELLALELAGRALDAAPDDGPTLTTTARVLAGLGRLDDVDGLLTRAVATPALGADVLSELAGIGIEAEAFPQALACAERGLRARSDDLVLTARRAEALLELDRPADAVPSLEAALGAIHRHAARIEGVRLDYEHLEQWLVSLHEDAVRRSASAEKVIDAHVAAGRLDPHAGENYRLMAHSLLVESTALGRRRYVPSQAELRADAEHEAPDRSPGHEDRGLLALRDGDLVGAEAAFRRALDVAPSCWPALAGLGATLELHADPPWRGLPAPPSLPALAGLVEPWAALTPVERDLVALAVAPFAARLPALVEAGARLHVVALDARLTELDAFRDARGELVPDEDDRRTHDAIDGMARGLVAGIKIEALYERDADRWTLAHELGHVLHASLDDDACAEVERLYAAARKVPWRSTGYGLRNPFEFFATGYERFALRRAFGDAARGEVHQADVDLGVDALFRALLPG